MDIVGDSVKFIICYYSLFYFILLLFQYRRCRWNPILKEVVVGSMLYPRLRVVGDYLCYTFESELLRSLYDLSSEVLKI